MSINYCTLANTSIDRFCNPTRGKVFARLVAAAHPVQPSVPKAGHGSQNIRRQDWSKPDFSVPPVPSTEQPVIGVAVEIFGFNGVETQDAAQRLDFVVVTDLEFGADGAVSVNISDLEI